eukprot:TRINITY_DN2910_c0_g1_i1.p1 TRINITY_DN2910_c0_g1~~TRINITY_DN2910_c0_g1_i1.p1  ORF type:complete len:187 (-),score=23.34 TRINITY_DN2910_c0_g1_i1:71-568(-)
MLNSIVRRTLSKRQSLRRSKFSREYCSKFQVSKTIKYSKDNKLWVTLDQDIATIGITQYTKESVGNKVLLVALPPKGVRLSKGNILSVIHSSFNAQSEEDSSIHLSNDLQSPISGLVLQENEVLESEPTSISVQDPSAAWLVKLRLTDYKEVNDLIDGSPFGTVQ